MLTTLLVLLGAKFFKGLQFSFGRFEFSHFLVRAGKEISNRGIVGISLSDKLQFRNCVLVAPQSRVGLCKILLCTDHSRVRLNSFFKERHSQIGVSLGKMDTSDFVVDQRMVRISSQ